MNRAELIREYLRNVGATSPEAAVTRLQVREALNLSRRFSSSMCDLLRSEFVAAVGEVGSQRYYLTGKTVPVPMTPAEVVEWERTRQEARRRKAGKATRAEYLAACGAKKDARAAEKAAEKATKKAKREAKRLAAEQKRRAAQDKAVVRAQAIVAQMRVPKQPRVVTGGLDKYGPGKSSIAQPKASEVWPSVEDFIRAGGVIQVLQNGDVSKPFRAIGFNNRRAA